MVCAGAGALLSGRAASAQTPATTAIEVAGAPVEFTASLVSQYTGERVEGPLTLQVYPGADGVFTLYEDDGATFNYRKGEWTGVRMTWHDAKRRLTLRLAEGSRRRPPFRRDIEVRLASEGARRATAFEGRPVEVQL